MTTPSTTLILGAGFGGISLANTLRKLAPADHKIVLVDRDPYFRIGATKTWLALGIHGAESMQYPRDALGRRDLTWIQDDVVEVRPDEKSALLKRSGRIAADFLVIALGAEMDFQQIPGLSSAHTFYTVDGANALRRAFEDFPGGRLMILIPSVPFKCPPAPYEAAMLFQDELGKRNLPVKAEVAVHTVEGAPMATAGPLVGEAVKQLLQDRNIPFHGRRRTLAVHPDLKQVEFEHGNEPYDLLVVVPPHVPSRALRDSRLVGEQGWIIVDPFTLEVPGFAGVYAIGDVASIPLPGRYNPDAPLALPKAGVAADAQGKIVAQRIAAKVSGQEAASQFDGKLFCYLESGNNEATRAEGSFFELPHPQMNFQAPNARQFEEKLSWAEDWVRDALGIAST